MGYDGTLGHWPGGWLLHVVAVIQTISNRDVSSQVRVEQGRTGQAIWHLLLEGEASLVQTSSGPCAESSPSFPQLPACQELKPFAN